MTWTPSTHLVGHRTAERTRCGNLIQTRLRGALPVTTVMDAVTCGRCRAAEGVGR